MHDRLAKLGAEALLSELPAYLRGERPAVPQITRRRRSRRC
jgi:hypothetical protein